MAGLLAVDFDGVICDAFDECALITWLGVHSHDRTVPGDEQLKRVPSDFLDRFRTVRNYSRLLDHFVVAHQSEAATLRSQATFDSMFRVLPSAYISRFTAAATDARDWFRSTEPTFWLDLHTVYPGISELLQRHAGSVVIVTAKDENSVRAILERNSLAWTVSEVYGDCHRKAEAIRELCARRDVVHEAVTFIDDNLTNVRRVAETGARALWARWGYQTAEHRADAERGGVEVIALSDLARLHA